VGIGGFVQSKALAEKTIVVCRRRFFLQTPLFPNVVVGTAGHRRRSIAFFHSRLFSPFYGVTVRRSYFHYRYNRQYSEPYQENSPHCSNLQATVRDCLCHCTNAVQGILSLSTVLQ